MNKPIIIHHSADYDGIFCREIARKFLPDAEIYGWDFGDKQICCDGFSGDVYVLDLSPDCLRHYEEAKLIWIDHHKSAIEKYPSSIPGYRIDNVAACRLAWQWFVWKRDGGKDSFGTAYGLPEKKHFVDRVVGEPLAVRLAGEYDIWDHRDDDADIAFQFGLDSERIIKWGILLSDSSTDTAPSGQWKWEQGGDVYAKQLVEKGRAAMQCYAKRDADIMKARSFMVEWEGLKFLALNTARCNSNTFAEKDVPETGHDALLACYWNGKVWNVSLYHASHRKDIDLSLIAVKNGGGGHRGACGFRADKLPFLP